MFYLIQKKVFFNAALFFLGTSFLIRDVKALTTCWDTVNSATLACNQDTCKTQIEYSTGFLALPTRTSFCVDKATDTDGPANNNVSCSNCDALVTGGWADLNLARGCVLNSKDGKIITICSQENNGNRPKVTSCYQGGFLATNVNSISSTACTPATTFFEFCRLENSPTSNAQIATCATECIDSSTVACCSANGCNKPLVCYTGTYYVTSLANLQSGTYTKTVCPIYKTGTDKNQYCKIVYSYSLDKGVTLTGTCENTCTNEDVIKTTTGASGTFCCTSNLCNSRASKSYLIVDKFIPFFVFGISFLLFGIF